MRIGSATVGSWIGPRQRTVGLLRARPALDHRIDGLEVARVGRQRDRHLAGGQRRAGRRKVVLDVAGAALRVGRDRLDASARPRTRAGSTRTGRPTVCASTFRRPRCAIPITISCAPAAAAIPIDSSSIGTITSRPSSENCFWPRKLGADRARTPPTCDRRSSRHAAPRRQAAGGSGRTRSPGAATRAARGPRCSISYAIVPQ